MKILIYVIVFIISSSTLLAGRYEDAFYDSVGDHPKCIAYASSIIEKVWKRDLNLIDWTDFDLKNEKERERATRISVATELYLNFLISEKTAFLKTVHTISDDVFDCYEDYGYLFLVREKFLKILRSKIY